MEKKTPITFRFTEIITCGAVLSGFELCEAINRLGYKCYVESSHNNEELEKYFKIKPIRKPKGITITFTPKLTGDYAYIRTEDERWKSHKEKKIAVSEYIAKWIDCDIIIGNGTHQRFKDLKIERDIDILVEGNDEPNKNIGETIEVAKQIGNKIVWFGRNTRRIDGVQSISSPSIEKIPELYNRSKTLLKMSGSEGWGRPVAEAMACGCNVINGSGGNRDIKIVKWKKIAKQLLHYLSITKGYYH
jgi:glycosyltransferase involved in cell wall biosynthesis